MCVLSHSVGSNSLWPRGLLPVRHLCPWDFPDKNTGVGCNPFLQSYPQGFQWNAQELYLFFQKKEARVSRRTITIGHHVCSFTHKVNLKNHFANKNPEIQRYSVSSKFILKTSLHCDRLEILVWGVLVMVKSYNWQKQSGIFCEDKLIHN